MSLRKKTAFFSTTLLPVEKIMLLYLSFTTLLIFAGWHSFASPTTMLGNRFLIIGGLGLVILLDKFFNHKYSFFIRHLYQIALLGFWYGETYQFNLLFPNLDAYFASIEQYFFHCQPALLFPQWGNNLYWSELFNFGYWSYYPMIGLVFLLTFFIRLQKFEKTTFILMTSFFGFYLIYLFLPVVGPQYYFQAIGTENITSSTFPLLGSYFKLHQEFLPNVDYHGFFFHLVESAQQTGEFPTAAFPSSHVGITTVLLLLSYNNFPKLLFVLLPCAILLFCGTVYTQAHYLIDAIAGVFFGIFFYFLASKLYIKLDKKPHLL